MICTGDGNLTPLWNKFQHITYLVNDLLPKFKFSGENFCICRGDKIFTSINALEMHCIIYTMGVQLCAIFEV